MSSGANNYYNHRFSVKTDEQVLQLLSAACIAEWVRQKPSADAIMTMDDGESIHLPVFALRRRNAVVAPLPDARVPTITA